MTRFVWFLPLTVVLGCAAAPTFDRADLRRQIERQPELVPPTKPLVPPPLRAPITLALYFKRTEPTQDRWGQPPLWTWEEADRADVRGWLAGLRAEGRIGRVIEIPDLAAWGDPEMIRNVAKVHGADAVLVLNGAAETQRRRNPAAALYLTLVGLFVAPGTQVDSVFVATGALWDARKPHLYFTLQAEGAGRHAAPEFSVDPKTAVAEAKQRALQAFGQTCLSELRGLEIAAAALPAQAAMP